MRQNFGPNWKDLQLQLLQFFHHYLLIIFICLLIRFCSNVERLWNYKSNFKSFLLIPLLLHPKWLVECDRRALLYLKRRIEIFFVKTQLALMGSNSASSWKKKSWGKHLSYKMEKKWHLRPISWEKLPSILKVWPWLRKKEKPIIKKLLRHTSSGSTLCESPEICKGQNRAPIFWYVMLIM